MHSIGRPSEPRISLDQWRAMVAVVDAGGYAQAAEVLHKSQSAVTYAVQKIELMLGVRAFEIQGRKAVLTSTGQMLYRRALALIAEASDLEQAAHKLSAGWEAEIAIGVEVLFPTSVLLDCLSRFAQESPRTRIEVVELVHVAMREALLNGQIDLAVTPDVPPGLLHNSLMRTRLMAVAHPDHPLHQLGREVGPRDLRAHRHITVRDTGPERERRSLAVEVEQRWTVSHMAAAIQAVCSGHGFAWFPEARIRRQLTSGVLRPLPLKEGSELWVEVYIVLGAQDLAGPGVRRLAQIIREAAARL